MGGRRRALIIANATFDHAELGRLRAPSADAEALASVLGDDTIGGFEVEVVHDEPSHVIQGKVEDLFVEGRPDDLLLLHFSGHGLKSDSGELFLAGRNTRPDRLGSSAVPAEFVQRCMRGSRARSIVLLLDCCYGGAFSRGVAVRSAGPVNVLESFPMGRLGGGRGRAVITASNAMEFAFEGTTLAADDQVRPSVFTDAVVEGLRTGEADLDGDGLVSLNELYDYVFDHVRARNPHQTPSRDIELQGELYLARSPRPAVAPTSGAADVADLVAPATPSVAHADAQPSGPPAAGRARPRPLAEQTASTGTAGPGRWWLGSAAVLALSLVLPQFLYSDRAVTSAPVAAAGVAVLAVLSLVAGVGALRSETVRRHGQVLAWGLAGGAAVVVVLLVDRVRDSGASSLNTGWWVAVAGCVALAAGAVNGEVARALYAADPGRRPPPPTEVQRLVSGLALLSGALVLTSSLAVQFDADGPAYQNPRYFWTFLVTGLIVATGGAVLRRNLVVGATLTASAAPPAAWLLFDFPRIWAQNPGAQRTGFWLGALAYVLVAATAVLALVVARTYLRLVGSDARDGRQRLAVGLGLVSAIPFLLLAAEHATNASQADAVHDVGTGALAVTMAVVIARLRPAVAARALAIGWFCGAGALVATYLSWLDYAGTSAHGIGWSLLPLAALGVLGATTRDEPLPIVEEAA